MTTAPRIIRLLVMGAALCAPLHASAQEAGIIEEIRGRAYWKSSARPQTMKLHPKRDKGRLLRAGDRVRCDPGGELRLRLYGRTLQLSCGATWYPIPYVEADTMDPVRQVLATYGSRGGGDRGLTSIYSPANRANVRPSTFEIRWIPKVGQAVRSLVIREKSPSGREILRQNIVDAFPSHISLESARRALNKYREDQRHGPLVLVLLGAREVISSVTFFLLSAESEQSLDRELMLWKREPEGIWKHLGMAHAFTVRDMFTEAAEEYEAALKHAPEGIDLLKKTIAAHKLTGNTTREQELSVRLKTLRR